MFGLVRAKKVRELESKVEALEKQLQSLTFSRGDNALAAESADDDAELANELEKEYSTTTWEKAKEQLVQLAARHPTPQTLAQVEKSLDIIRKLEQRERSRERYYKGEVLNGGRGPGRPSRLEKLLEADPEELEQREDDLHALFVDYYARVRDKPWFRLIKGRVNDYVRNQLQIENFDLDELQDPGKFDLVMKAAIPRLKQYIGSVTPSSSSASSSGQGGGLAVSPTLNPRNPGPLLLQNGVPVGQLQVAGAEEQKQ